MSAQVTPIARLRIPVSLISAAINVRTKGLGVRATRRSFGKSHSTVIRWERRMAQQVSRWSPVVSDGVAHPYDELSRGSRRKADPTHRWSSHSAVADTSNGGSTLSLCHESGSQTMAKGDMTDCGVVAGPFGTVKAVTSIAPASRLNSVYSTGSRLSDA